MLKMRLPWRRRELPSLKSFRGEVASHRGYRLKAPRYQAVPIDRIVGSVNRWQDYDEAFQPRKRHQMSDTPLRMDRLKRLVREGKELPSVSLYELDGEFYVEDGHHRVVVSKGLGRQFVDAYVREVVVRPTTDTPLEMAA